MDTQTNAVQGIKVFEMNDCDWVAAAALEEAIQSYAPPDLVEDELLNPVSGARELSTEELDTLNFIQNGGEGPSISFREELTNRVLAGQRFPQFFASTEY